jgi:septal ring factor EnvC (AmiA/AmiB activator)
MMGLSVAPPGIAEIAAQAATLALPAKSKAVLKDIADQLANLAAARNEFAVAKAQIAADRAAADKFAAELNERSRSLDDAGAALAVRVAKFQAAVADFESKLAAHATALEQTP